MKKTAICISTFMIIGILCLGSFGKAAEGYPGFGTLGSDQALTDTTNDLYKVSGSSYESTGTQISWIDLINATFEEGSENYTITATLSGDYDSRVNIYFYVEINGSTREDYEQHGAYADFYLFLMEGGSSHVQCGAMGEIWSNQSIVSISSNVVTFTFPKSEIQNLILNIKPISEWIVLSWAYGESGDTTYYDFLPNFSDVSPIDGIPGFPLLMIGLISVVSVFLILRKVRKS